MRLSVYAAGKKIPMPLRIFFFFWNDQSERRIGGHFMAKNNTNNMKPSMRKVKEALAIKTAHRKASNDRVSAKRAIQKARRESGS
jgi:hypothetical protein